MNVEVFFNDNRQVGEKIIATIENDKIQYIDNKLLVLTDKIRVPEMYKTAYEYKGRVVKPGDPHYIPVIKFIINQYISSDRGYSNFKWKEMLVRICRNKSDLSSLEKAKTNRIEEKGKFIEEFLVENKSSDEIVESYTNTEGASVNKNIRQLWEAALSNQSYPMRVTYNESGDIKEFELIDKKV